MFQGRAGCVTLPDSLSMKQYPCSLFLTETNQSFINPVLRSICDFEETAYSAVVDTVVFVAVDGTTRGDAWKKICVVHKAVRVIILDIIIYNINPFGLNHPFILIKNLLESIL